MASSLSSSTFFLASLLLIICSDRIFVRCSPDLDGFLKQTESMVGQIEGQFSPCMQKILPCRPFIKSPENPPPACCLPLKEMVTGDVPCLCSFFNNLEMLKTLNVSQTEALMLPKACALDVDISKCHSEGAKPPTSSSSTGSTDAPTSSTSPPNTSATTSNDSSPSSSTMKNNPSYGFAAAFSILALLLHFNSAHLYDL